MAAWSSLPYLRPIAVAVVHRWCLGIIATLGNAPALDRGLEVLAEVLVRNHGMPPDEVEAKWLRSIVTPEGR